MDPRRPKIRDTPSLLLQGLPFSPAVSGTCGTCRQPSILSTPPAIVYCLELPGKDAAGSPNTIQSKPIKIFLHRYLPTSPPQTRPSSCRMQTIILWSKPALRNREVENVPQARDATRCAHTHTTRSVGSPHALKAV